MFTNSRICILCILIYTYIQKKKKSQFCIKTSEACKLQISSFLYDRKLDNSHILSFQIIQIQRGTMKEDQVTFGQRSYGGRKAMHLSADGWWQTTVCTGRTELWYQAETLHTGSVEMSIIRESYKCSPDFCLLKCSFRSGLYSRILQFCSKVFFQDFRPTQ